MHSRGGACAPQLLLEGRSSWPSHGRWYEEARTSTRHRRCRDSRSRGVCALLEAREHIYIYTQFKSVSKEKSKGLSWIFFKSQESLFVSKKQLQDAPNCHTLKYYCFLSFKCILSDMRFCNATFEMSTEGQVLKTSLIWIFWLMWISMDFYI